MTSRSFYTKALPEIVMYANKPKALKLAKVLKQGAVKRGIEFTITDQMTPRPNSIGFFYGVVPQTYACFRFYMAEGRAVYLDNGWLSTPEKQTFRFSWNSAQSFLQDMEPVPNWRGEVANIPQIDWQPIPNRALLILQSPLYFECMRLGYTLEQWTRVTTKILEGKGYEVEVRAKPRVKHDPRSGEPAPITFFEQLERASIAVSLNSAATVKALRYGIPAYCMLDCTPSPLAPVRIPDAGRAAPPSGKAVDDMCSRMLSQEITLEDMDTGIALDRILGTPQNKRRGFWYSQ